MQTINVCFVCMLVCCVSLRTPQLAVPCSLIKCGLWQGEPYCTFSACGGESRLEFHISTRVCACRRVCFSLITWALCLTPVLAVDAVPRSAWPRSRPLVGAAPVTYCTLVLYPQHTQPGNLNCQAHVYVSGCASVLECTTGALTGL